MKNRHLLLILLFFLVRYNCLSQKQVGYTAKEKDCISLFKDFSKYLADCIEKKKDFGDSVQIEYLLSHYVFVNVKADTVGGKNRMRLQADQLYHLKKELNTFYQYFQERTKQQIAENLVLIPMRLSSPKFIYNKLTTFQKENTFLLFDKRAPKNILGYILFIPPVKNKLPAARIWSWTLMFKLGKFIFKSVTGEEGEEYMFSPENYKR